MSERHRDKSGEYERKRNDTLVETIRKKDPDFAVGIIRKDASLGTLKEKIGLPANASENKVKTRVKNLQKKL
jgi:hypothetical protein